MTPQPIGQRELFVSLVDGNVHLVVIGGYAVAAHGYERATRDVDIVFDSRALTVELSDGTALRVCSYEHLVAMKQLAGRPRDLEDLRELEAVREHQAER